MSGVVRNALHEHGDCHRGCLDTSYRTAGGVIGSRASAFAVRSRTWAASAWATFSIREFGSSPLPPAAKRQPKDRQAISWLRLSDSGRMVLLRVRRSHPRPVVLRQAPEVVGDVSLETRHAGGTEISPQILSRFQVQHVLVQVEPQSNPVADCCDHERCSPIRLEHDKSRAPNLERREHRGGRNRP